MKTEAETGMMWPQPKDTWSHQDMLPRCQQKYKTSQDLSVGLACHHCLPVPLTKQSLQWEGQNVIGQRPWDKQRGEESGASGNPPQCLPVPAGLNELN